MSDIVITSYAYQIWTEQGAMIRYVSDQTTLPYSYSQIYLEGKEKAEAIAIVEMDKAEAGNSEFYQSTLNESQRLYLRKSKISGNAWEIMFDENWVEIPNPYLPGGGKPPPAPIPRAIAISLRNCTLKLEFNGQQITQTITGTAIPPTA